MAESHYFSEIDRYLDFLLLKIHLNKKSLYIGRQFVFTPVVSINSTLSNVYIDFLSSDHYWKVMRSFIRANYHMCIVIKVT